MGLTFEKLLIIGVIAAFLIGPERLPVYTEKLAHLIRRLRGMADGAKTRMQEELGEDFREEDWRKLDPRQYDPRRIVRQALLDGTAPTTAAAGGAAGAASARPVQRRVPEPLEAGESAPFDREAT